MKTYPSVSAVSSRLAARQRPTLRETQALVAFAGELLAHEQAIQTHLRDTQYLAQRYDHLVRDYNALISVLRRLGLEIEGLGLTATGDVEWSYRWLGGPIRGPFASVDAAVAAALIERLGGSNAE